MNANRLRHLHRFVWARDWFTGCIFCGLLITALSDIKAADPLPRVLILGDSIYQQPARDVAKALKDRIDVVYVTMKPGEVRNTETALANLAVLLGNDRWDLIHFNFGLGDLVYRVPGIKAFRVMSRKAGGVRATSPLKYKQNLEQLVERLKATGAKLVWANTTPIRHSTSQVFDPGSEIEYNAIATQVMRQKKVAINDMHSHVKNLIDMKKPASHGADPFFFDRKPIHPAIVDSILAELNLSSKAIEVK